MLLFRVIDTNQAKHDWKRDCCEGVIWVGDNISKLLVVNQERTNNMTNEQTSNIVQRTKLLDILEFNETIIK